VQRRAFLKSSAAVAAVAITSRHANALIPEPSSFPTGAKYFSLNTGWRFAARAVPQAQQPDFDDSSFEEVVLPHSTTNLPWHDFDDKAYEFVSTYRRHFRLPGAARGQRVFLDFEGAMLATSIWINGHALGEYRGGYTPFSFELTPFLTFEGDNVITISLDSTERADIPPFGKEVDYLTFGGIYREAALRVVPQAYIDNVFALSLEVLTDSPKIEVNTFLVGAINSRGLSLHIELLEGEQIVASHIGPVRIKAGKDVYAETHPVTVAPVSLSSQSLTDPNRLTVILTPLSKLKLWDIDAPHLYEVRVTLLRGDKIVDRETRRIGIREAMFTDKGFSLNGNIIKLRGLDRHQMFPFAGQAMAARAQRRDADILRLDYHCNIVRTSHYPQSRHFLDRCDEIGLLVLEEIPGWQYVGPLPWQDISVDNVARMIRRDWNHPSIILWGVRINESRDNHDFYTRTNAAAHGLDPSRQTGGIRNFVGSEFLEDVFTINDFGFPLKSPNHPRYLNTEFVGHVFPTRVTDDDERQREHTLHHARIHDQLASDAQFAGGIGWCAFDYNTHASFGAGDRMCYHGVFDIFREPKPAAGFYKSQVDPKTEVVLEPAFHWARGDESLIFTEALFCSNCDDLKIFIRPTGDATAEWKQVGEVKPDHTGFPHLKYPPFRFQVSEPGTAHMNIPWGDMRVEGYIGGERSIVKQLSGSGVSTQFHVKADDSLLVADGADVTRVVMRATDEFGAPRPLADDPIRIHLEGPATLVGPEEISLVGGVAAVWVRSKFVPGTITLTATHPRLGAQSVVITTKSVSSEAL
jgi:beta-galactosidase